MKNMLLEQIHTIHYVALQEYHRKTQIIVVTIEMYLVIGRRNFVHIVLRM